MASFQVHAHTLDARGESEVPLAGYSDAEGHVNWQNILNQLFGLDIGHTVNTGDTITIQRTRLVHCKQLNPSAIVLLIFDVDAVGHIAGKLNFFLKLGEGGDVPDREDTTGLSDVDLLLDTTDSLLEEGRDLGGRGLGLSSVVTDLLGGDGGDGSASLDAAEFCQSHN